MMDARTGSFDKDEAPMTECSPAKIKRPSFLKMRNPDFGSFNFFNSDRLLAKESAQHGIKTEDEETAVSCTSQNIERDAPWTAWSKMLQPHEEPASSSTYNPQSSHSRSFAVNNSFEEQDKSVVPPYEAASSYSFPMSNLHPNTLPLCVPWRPLR
jgi:hypothetical protein